MIDLVCPIWNRKEFLDLTLRSLDKYLDFRKVYRLLLLDDCSTDGASEVAQAWAAKHECATYRQARNPTLSTSWPLFEALRVLDTSNWLGIWLSDWYMCQPLIPVIETAMSLVKDDADVISCLTMRVTDDRKYTPDDILRIRRHRNTHGSIRGGFNLFRRRFLDRARPVFEQWGTWGSISAMFNGVLRAKSVSFCAHWIAPPLAFLHLDEDIPGNKLTQHFYKAEGLDVPHILDLTRRYAANGWCRNEVVRGGIVQRAKVHAVYPKGGDTRPKGWRRL